jgi:hypothetical protein
MTFEEFQASVGRGEKPEGVSAELLALWTEARGDWKGAHEIVQDIESREAAWVHAHLHRREGDLGNAAYWYARARKSVCNAPLEDEWAQIARELIR